GARRVGHRVLDQAEVDLDGLAGRVGQRKPTSLAPALEVLRADQLWPALDEIEGRAQQQQALHSLGVQLRPAGRQEPAHARADQPPARAAGLDALALVELAIEAIEAREHGRVAELGEARGVEIRGVELEPALAIKAA